MPSRKLNPNEVCCSSDVERVESERCKNQRRDHREDLVCAANTLLMEFSASQKQNYHSSSSLTFNYITLTINLEYMHEKPAVGDPATVLGVAVIIGQTADNLKAFLCESNWWDHSFTISKKCPALCFAFYFGLVQWS